MKKILSILLILGIFLSLPVSRIDAEAQGVIINVSTSYLDIGGSITTGTAYNNDFMSITTNTGIATASFNQTNGALTIKGVSDGYTEVKLRLGTVDDYKEYVYKVYVTSVFDNVTYNYSYDKITVNYNKNNLPDGCVPVFSIDGQNWSESSTLTRDMSKDGNIYKAFKLGGVVTGSIKKLTFDTKNKNTKDKIEKTLELNVGDSYSFNNIIKTTEKYKYYTENGMVILSFNESNLSLKATSEGNTTLTLYSASDKTFGADGSINSTSTEYIYKIKVKSKDSSASGGSSSSKGSSGGQSGSNKQSGITIKNTKGKWKSNATGWWFEEEGGTYPVNDWRYIDDNWYFFNKSGYMESNCYRYGCWLGSSGAWNTNYRNGKWKSNSKGWWYEDSGWYPVNQWLMIDGYWYYFKGDGYMAANEYIDGYWLGSDGAWR